MPRFDSEDGFSTTAVDRIYLDDIEQNLATMADTDLGCIIRYKTGKDGFILTIDNIPCREEIAGNVKVTFREGWGMNEAGEYTFRSSAGQLSTFEKQNRS